MLRSRSCLAVLPALFVLLSGCSGGGSVAVTPAPIPGLSISTLTAFTAVAGSTSAQTLTLTNTGTATLTLSSVALGGTNPTAFAMTNTCGVSLAPNATCSVTLTFAPPSVGTFSATVTITDNAAGSPQTVTLTGTGVAVTAPSITFSPASLTFPATNLATASASQSVAITNYGTAPLTISNIAITGASSFSQTNNCPASLPAATGNCSVYVTFTPTHGGADAAILSVTDNVAGSPQTVILSGTSTAPAASLSATSLTFSGAPNTTTAAQSIILTNTGTATLNIAGITLGGANSSSFAETTTCGATLAAAANCTISATFTPAALTTYTATIGITDSATTSPQVITLTGTGAATSSITHTLYVFPEADNSATPLYALINSATKTIDMTMYALQDNNFTNALVAACQRGVVVRVVLDQNNEKSHDTPNFNTLNAQPGCTAVWANKAFQVTHEKSFILDSTQVAIMSLNLQSQYYSTTRDYALIENDPADIAAIQATFNADFAAGTTSAGVVGASDFSYQPQPGTDLTWSPTTATANMLAIINNATKTLYIENEEFGAPNIVSAIAAAAQRGVTVIFVGESTSYLSNYATVKAAGASVYYYTSSTGFYVHGKTVVADLGLSTEAVYMGSINYSTASLTQNRELGIYITGNTTVSHPIAATIAATIISDETQAGVTKY